MLRVADASLGDYYTKKEFKKLGKEQKAEYCAELARQDSTYKAEMLSLRDELDQSRSRSQRLREEGDSLFAFGTALETRIAAPGDAGGKKPRDGGKPRGGEKLLPGKADHVVRRGESLWAISASPEIYGQGARWSKIYEANRERIHDPNLIFPGQELSIPK